MSPRPMNSPSDLILEHQDFVRRLARSLVGSDDRAADVAQETWITALGSKGAIASPRGWLATIVKHRAANLARGDERRRVREERAVREDRRANESELRERAELARTVVEAVFALREPYKTVVLMRFYEDLTPAEIAERRGVPAGTVRAQLSRALDELRERLDHKTDGGRAAWSAILLTDGWTKPTMSTIAKLLTAAAAALAVSGVGAGIWALRANPAPSDPAWITMNSIPALAPAAETTVLEMPPPTANVNDSRAVIEESAARAPILIGDTELDGMLTTGVQIQRLLRERLLVPDPALIDSRRDLSAMPGVGFARIYQRGVLGAAENNLIGLRGAGAFYSFVTSSHDYNDEPTVGLDRSFNCGYWIGAIVRVGKMSLADMGVDAMNKPPSVSEEYWRTLWQESKAGERDVDPGFRQRLRTIFDTSDPSVVVRNCYLVRNVDPGDHDILGAFEVLAKDDKSVTIAWRVLKTWDVPHTDKGTRPDPFASVPPAPPELSALTVEELMQRHAELVERATPRILALPDPLDPALAVWAAKADCGVGRIAERGRWGPIMWMDGAGAYYSFTTHSNDYQQQAQLELQQGSFGSGFAGHDVGFVLDLGERPLEAIPVDGEVRGLDEHSQKGLAFMLGVTLEPEADPKRQSELRIPDRDRLRAPEFGVNRAPAKIGHTYLLRQVASGQRDVLVAFQVAARDEAALTIVWRLLSNKPAVR